MFAAEIPALAAPALWFALICGGAIAAACLVWVATNPPSVLLPAADAAATDWLSVDEPTFDFPTFATAKPAGLAGPRDPGR